MYSVDMDQKPMSSLQRKNRMKRMEEIRYSHDESLYNLQEEYSETDPEYDYDAYDRNDGYHDEYRERRKPQQQPQQQQQQQRGSYGDSYDDYHYQQQPDDYRMRKTVSLHTPSSRKQQQQQQQPMSRDSRYSERSSYDHQMKQIPTIDEDDDYQDEQPQKVIKAKLRLNNLSHELPASSSSALPSPKSAVRPSSLKTSGVSRHPDASTSPRILEESEYETSKNSKDSNVADDGSKGEASAAAVPSTPETPTAKKSFKMHLVPNKKLFKVPEMNQLSKLSCLFNSTKISATKSSKKDESAAEKAQTAEKAASSSQKSEKNKKPQDAKQSTKNSGSGDGSVVANAHTNAPASATQEENKKVSKEKKDSKSHSSANIEKKSSVNSREFEVNFSSVFRLSFSFSVYFIFTFFCIMLPSVCIEPHIIGHSLK